MDIAERIDEIIQKRNLSRRGLALQADIPPTTFQSAMERGTMSVEMAKKIADALCVSITEIIGCEQNTKQSTASEGLYSNDLDLLLESFSRLGHDDRELIINMAQALASRRGK